MQHDNNNLADNIMLHMKELIVFQKLLETRKY